MPTFARKAINRFIEDFSLTTQDVLFVGVNRQWETHYRNLFEKYFTIDIRPETNPDLIDNIEHSKLPDDRFDGVIVVGVWELLNIDKTMGEVKRLLKKGGRLLFGFPGIGFSNPNRVFSVREVVAFIEQHLNIEKLEVIYYKSELSFYILGVARK